MLVFASLTLSHVCSFRLVCVLVSLDCFTGGENRTANRCTAHLRKTVLSTWICGAELQALAQHGKGACHIALSCCGITLVRFICHNLYRLYVVNAFRRASCLLKKKTCQRFLLFRRSLYMHSVLAGISELNLLLYVKPTGFRIFPKGSAFSLARLATAAFSLFSPVALYIATPLFPSYISRFLLLYSLSVLLEPYIYRHTYFLLLSVGVPIVELYCTRARHTSFFIIYLCS